MSFSLVLLLVTQAPKAAQAPAKPLPATNAAAPVTIGPQVKIGPQVTTGPQVRIATAPTPRFVIEDEAWEEKVVAEAVRLKGAGKLRPLGEFRGELGRGRTKLNLPPPGTARLSPAEVHDRLIASTLSIGLLVRESADSDEYHWDGATGYVITADGVAVTCRHVIEQEPEDVAEAWLAAADRFGNVHPISAVVASDPDADACFVRVQAPNLKPLPIRSGVRTGEPVHCLSHPGAVYFLFTSGHVARVLALRDPDDDPTFAERVVPPTGRAVLHLNITAEFAPGSSGGPCVDEFGNLVGHIVSIADVNPPDLGGEFSGSSDKAALERPAEAPAEPSGPSVAVRYCLASEEVLRLAGVEVPNEADRAPPLKSRSTPLAGLAKLKGMVDRIRSELDKDSDVGRARAVRLFEAFDLALAKFRADHPKAPERWYATLLAFDADQRREDAELAPLLGEPTATLEEVMDAEDAPEEARRRASRRIILFDADDVEDTEGFRAWEQRALEHLDEYADDPGAGELQKRRLELCRENAPAFVEELARELEFDGDDEVASAARKILQSSRRRKELLGSPVEIRFRKLTGEPARLSDLRGKFLVIDWWAPWCEPCLEAIPRLRELADRYKGRVEFIGIALDDDDDAIEEAIREQSIPWPQYRVKGGFESPIAKRFGIDALPTIWIVGPDGRLLDGNAGEDLTAALEKHLPKSGK
jgi:thiol-disulfide isomerase/thioredoxin